MIELKYLTYYILFIYLYLGFLNCSENPTENNDTNNSDTTECPYFENIPSAPYDTPIWHPSGNFIGFNYTQLDSITFPNGEHCAGKQHFNYDSSGFWLVDIDGKNMRRILDYKLLTPAWSPDGRWIVFVMDANIFKMPFNVDSEKFDTTQIDQLTFEGRNFFPAWNPDGEWIAYDSDKNSPTGLKFIWKMKYDGSLKKRLAYTPEKGEIRKPNWSTLINKITHIRYSIDFTTDAPEICIMDTSGFNFRRLTFNNIRDDNPKYSNDGTKIVFTSQQDDGSIPQLWLMDTDGSNIKQITEDGIESNFGTPFNWAPNSNRIVYTKYNNNNWTYENGTIWIIDLSTGLEYQLTVNSR